MNIILFDSYKRNSLLPLTFTRPTAAIRTGIVTIREKWELLLQQKLSFLTATYLKRKFPVQLAHNNILIDGTFIPDKSLAKQVLQLNPGELLYCPKGIIAFNINENELTTLITDNPEGFSTCEAFENYLHYFGFKKIEYSGNILTVEKLSDIYTLNEQLIRSDFELLTQGRKSREISAGNLIIGDKELVFIEPGAVVEGATINTKDGPVYIGKDAVIMEGSLIRGPFALGEHGVVKMGTIIYKGSTIGPYCKVAGEIQNVVMFGYSNKAHNGYFGNSVIGEWCNIGAATNTSNLKNNYGITKQWSYPAQNFIDTGLQFCGIVMGDHTKCGINTMFNSGTVIGVCCNLIGIDYHAKYIPSFSYGDIHSGYSCYHLDKAIETAKIIYKRRNLEFDEIEQEILEYIFENKQ